MIVIDVGCARYGEHVSIEHLIEEFHPDVLYGFDPHPSVDELSFEHIDGLRVIIERKAAWLYDGEIGFQEDRMCSYTGEEVETKVPCFDLAAFIEHLPSDEIVLKIDAENAEYALVSHLIATGADKRLSLALIEWHGPGISDTAEMLMQQMACEAREWLW